jgi:hypothetical protein
LTDTSDLAAKWSNPNPPTPFPFYGKGET